jgi:hypothetical protein
MEQKAFFHETVDDAIREDIRVCGGFKAIGHTLQPKKSPDDAATWLRNATNPNQNEGIDQHELMVILKRAAENRSSAFLDFLGQQFGFRVEWIDPEDEAAQIRREVRDQLKAVNQRMERLERAEQRAALKAVK